MRSEYSARLVQTFWPLITYASPLRTAVVARPSVSVPLRRLGHAEGLEAQAPGRDLRQPALLLRLVAVAQESYP